MQPIEMNEILNIADYELERETLRPKIMALKARRRFPVGPHLTFLFENRDTVRYQIQEMMRIERIVKTADIAHEVETYNELLPQPGELSGCLLVEYETPEEHAIKLTELLGLDDHVWIQVGDLPRSNVRFDSRQIATDRISAVQYIKISLTPSQMAQWQEAGRSGRIRLIVDHPKYNHQHTLTPEQAQEVAEDFL
jgi:hypothetical protein